MNLRQKYKRTKRLLEREQGRVPKSIVRQAEYQIIPFGVMRDVPLHEVNYIEHIKETMVDECAKGILDLMEFESSFCPETMKIKISGRIRLAVKE